MRSKCEANLVTVLASGQRRWLCHGSGSLSLASNCRLAWVQSQATLYWIYGEQSDMGTCIASTTSLLPCHCHSTSVSDLSDHPLLTLYTLNLRN